ncbi:MAG TPA: hypothetical protein VKB00_08275 [Candidatus Limnocylindrales bacterium]|nr:hypothetical protein [Candidatus Limnocylindrales bacterium]
MADNDAVEEFDELPEGAEMLPDEGQELIEQKEKEVLGKILDRAAEDPEFRSKMLDDPDSALSDIGVADEVDALDRASIGGLSEVAGQGGYASKYSYRCLRWRTRKKFVHWNY